MQFLIAIPVATVLLVFGFLVDLTPQPGSGEMLMVALACLSCIAALLFLPLRSSIRETVGHCALATSMLAVVYIALPGITIPAASLLRLVATNFLVSLVLLSLLRILPGEAQRARQFVVAGCIVLFAIPVWLGPVAELTGNPPLLTNFIVAASPVSAFATALDFDILRTSWFYEHSVLGSLRYDYQPWWTYIAVLLVLATITLILKPGVSKE